MWAGAAEGAAELEWDDFEGELALEEEEETLVLGGQGFSPQELAAAERHLDQSQVRTSLQCRREHVVIRLWTCADMRSGLPDFRVTSVRGRESNRQYIRCTNLEHCLPSPRE